MSDAPTPRRFCPQCGTPDDRGSAYCTRCGTGLPVAAAPPPASRATAEGPGGRGPLIAVSVVVALAVAAAGAVAWSTRGDDGGALDAGGPPTSTSSDRSPSASPSAAPSSPSTAPSVRPSAPASSAPSPGAPAATTTVTGDADGFADAEGITPVLQQYVDGINRRDYASAHQVLSTEAQTRTSLAEFVEGNRSTQITSFVLDVVYTASAGGVVEASFVSEQDAADGKDGQTCSRWTMTYTLVRSGSGPPWRIDRAQPQVGSPLPC